MTIPEACAALAAEFQELPELFDRYAYLVALAPLLEPYPPEKETDDRLVAGCQSRVWLDCTAEDGLFRFAARSDTLILNGVLYLLQQLLCGRPCAEVAAWDGGALLASLGLAGAFSDERQRGIAAAIALLRSKASALAQ